jgi:hypothetical protein
MLYQCHDKMNPEAHGIESSSVSEKEPPNYFCYQGFQPSFNKRNGLCDPLRVRHLESRIRHENDVAEIGRLVCRVWFVPKYWLNRSFPGACLGIFSFFSFSSRFQDKTQSKDISEGDNSRLFWTVWNKRFFLTAETKVVWTAEGFYSALELVCTSGGRNTEWSVLHSTEILSRVLYCIGIYII